MATPFFTSIVGSSRGSGLSHRPVSTLICRRPWRHALCGTRGFNQRWRGHAERPSCNTGDAAAMRPSILWNALSGRAVSLLKVAASFWMARARSGAITPLSCELSPRTVPRNDTRWLGNSALLANWPWAPGALSGWGWGFCVKVVPPLTGPEWASRRGSWECGFPSVLRGERAASMHFVKYGGPETAQRVGPCTGRPLPRRRISRIVCDGGLSGCESMRLSGPENRTSPLCESTRGFASAWSSWTAVSWGRDSGVWDREWAGGPPSFLGMRK